METPETRKAQVIIVGGGLTGLTLALMLERLNISYILLEAYPSLTKPVGTAIGLFANGQRIMNQLGVLDEIEETGQRPTRQEIIDAVTGEVISEKRMEEVADLMRERHGYVTTTMSRHELLVILDRHLKNRDSLLTNKRVKTIEQSDRAATVTCEDGTRYEAQFVVGADGVRSTVRREMWRLARETSPGWFPEKHTMRCEYALVFCMTPPSPHLEPGTILSIQRAGSNGGVMSGRQRELFLFYYWRLRPPHDAFTADAIPRVTAEEQAARWAEAAQLPINRGGLTFGDLMAAGVERAGATVLPHHAFDKWWFGRAIVIGDAAHKFNPLVGQGGNNCIESAAALVTELERCLAARGIPLQRGAEWPQDALAEVFATVQERRLPRVTEMIQKSQKAQYMAAWENCIYEFLNKYVVHRLPRSMQANVWSGYVVGCSRLKGKVWDRPERPHKLPYGDEIQKTSSSGPMSAMVVVVLVAAGVWFGRRFV